MRPAWVIARLTIRQILRRKILIPIAVIAGLVLVSEIATMRFMRYAVEADEEKMAEALAYRMPETIFSTFFIVGLVAAFVLGISLARQEIQDRTILATLSRPVSRAEYLVGRWFGLGLFLSIYWACVALATTGVAVAVGAGPTLAYPSGITLSWVLLTVLATVAVCANIVARPAAAGGLTLVVGLLPGLLQHAIQSPNPLVRWLAQITNFLLPSWDSFSRGDEMFKRGAISSNWSEPLWAFGHGVTYMAVLLVVGCWLFRRLSVVTADS